MSFFELPPPPEPEEPDSEETPTPTWAGPATNELGVELPLHRIVGESEAALIALQSVTAYENGLVFHLAARTKREPAMRDPFDDEGDDPFEIVRLGPRSPKFVRFGVAFSDGSKVSNVTPPPAWWDGDVSPPHDPVLIADGDDDGYVNYRGAIDLSYWLWPLPPGDSLRVVVEWPAEGIPETTTDLDTAPLLAAAAEDTHF